MTLRDVTKRKCDKRPHLFSLFLALCVSVNDNGSKNQKEG